MEFQVPAINLLLILPAVIVAGWGMLLMLIELFVPENRQQWVPWFTLVGLALALIQTVGLWGYSGGTFTPTNDHSMLLIDNFSTFLNATFLITGILTVLFSVHYLRRTGLDRSEFYMLVLFSISGMMLMGMANDLIVVFLALELLSIPLYILSGMAWPRPESEEAAMKYFLLGAFSSGIFVFGIALIYGATGSTALPDILAGLSPASALGMAGVVFLLVGLGFKVAAVPFHMWTPDVYEGAPTAVTAFMSVGAKAGGFAAMLRIFVEALPNIADIWVGAVAILAALTMILGNVVALVQPNIKRMLAYSSIAHAGYILIAVAASVHSPDGVSAALFYMFAYLFTNLGAFAIVIALEQQDLGILLDDYRGLARRSPWLALVMAYFMLSLTGVPPTGGFSGKFFVFRTAIEADLVWLAIVGVVTSVVSGYFYLRVVYLMYMHEGEGEVVSQPVALQTVVAFTALATFILGVLPGPWFEMTRAAALRSVQMLAGG